MRRWTGWLAAGLVWWLAAAPAWAACKVARLAELPVTMAGRRPMVAAKFGDHEVRFILDSGAFHSTLSRATAAEFGMKTQAAPPFFRVRGVGGDQTVSIARPGNFSLAGVPIPRADFVVGGSDTGTAGLLGQNILGLADVEYDLPHGAVRLMKVEGCQKMALAYWAGKKPFSTLPLEGNRDGPFKPHTIGTVLINGVKVHAVFDSGAEASLLSLAAAKRIGVTPTSPGVVQAGMSGGLGSRRVPTFVATFDKIDIAGEVIPRPRIRMADVEFGPDTDMLIGADFFLTHRLFVSNANRVLYMTYEGGPVFGADRGGARTDKGEQLDLTDTAADPTDAEGYSRRGAVFASNRKLPQALADFDKAVAMAPAEPRYLFQRASARMANRQPLLAAADLDKTIALQPDNTDARLARAQMRLGAHDPEGAAEDVKAADHALPAGSARRMQVAGLYASLDRNEEALANYDSWLSLHGDDSGRPTALNGRCWARALLNRDLDKAMADCNTALKLRPGDAAFLDSRALVQLRRGRLNEALADYDAAIKANPRSPWSLYARGLAYKRAGKPDLAEADRRAALAIDPNVAKRAARYGLEG